MLPPVRVWSRAEMTARVARFKDLKGFRDGLQDSALPECEKTVFNVLGFQTPEGAGMAGVNSPVGQRASANAAIKISEGFNDTNETFVVISGRWLVQWNEGEAMESLEVGPLDVISFPAGWARRFENATHDEPDAEHMLLFVVGGNEPQNEFTPRSMGRVEEFDRQGR